MKKVFLLIIMLFLAACSGGGSSSSSGGASDTNATGAVSLKFVDGTKQAAKQVASMAEAAPGRARILLSNSTFKKIVDFPFAEPVTTVTLPVGTYTAEAVYYENGTVRRLTSHGATSESFTVAADTSNAVTINMTPLVDSVAITPPATVYAGDAYSVAAPSSATLAAAGLKKEWSLAVRMTTDSSDPFTGAVHLAQSPRELHTNIVAPITDQPGTLYFQGEFFIKPELLEAGESATEWTFPVQATTTTTLQVKTITTGTGDLPTDTTKPQITSFSVPTSKQGTATISPITIAATDNAGITGYMITAPLEADPTTGNDSRWLTTAPTSYPYTGSILSGTDNQITLKAWVKDYSGNISLAVSGVTDKKVIINDSPVVTKFAVPSTTQFGPNGIPVTVAGKNYTGTDAVLKYMITEKPIAPSSSDLAWSLIPEGGATTYNVTSISQVSGTRYTVPLYAWVMDGNLSISQSLNNIVTISDVPQVTAFKVLSTVPNGNVVDIVDFTAAVAPATPERSISGYLITTTSTKPGTGDFVLTAPPTTFTYPGLTVGTSANRTLYAWVKDSSGLISLAKTAYVHFSAP